MAYKDIEMNSFYFLTLRNSYPLYKWHSWSLHWFYLEKALAKYYYNVALWVWRNDCPSFSWWKLSLWLSLLFVRLLILKSCWLPSKNKESQNKPLSNSEKIKQLVFENWDGLHWGQYIRSMWQSISMDCSSLVHSIENFEAVSDFYLPLVNVIVRAPQTTQK